MKCTAGLLPNWAVPRRAMRRVATVWGPMGPPRRPSGLSSCAGRTCRSTPSCARNSISDRVYLVESMLLGVRFPRRSGTLPRTAPLSIVGLRTPLILWQMCSWPGTASSSSGQSRGPLIHAGSGVPLLLCLVTSIICNLLLQHNTVNTRLKQRKHKAGLALEVAQPVEDLGARVRRQAVEEVGELFSCQSPRLPLNLNEGRILANLLHVLRKTLVLLQDLLLQGRKLRGRGQRIHRGRHFQGPWVPLSASLVCYAVAGGLFLVKVGEGVVKTRRSRGLRFTPPISSCMFGFLSLPRWKTPCVEISARGLAGPRAPARVPKCTRLMHILSRKRPYQP